MNTFGSVYWSLLAAGIAFLMVATFEIRLALSLGRTPVSRLLVQIVRDFGRLGQPQRTSAVGWGLALVAFQLYPLTQERLFGGSLPPDHIGGLAVIVAEIAFGAYVWHGTRPAVSG
jgi:hypothetical protein